MNLFSENTNIAIPFCVIPLCIASVSAILLTCTVTAFGQSGDKANVYRNLPTQQANIPASPAQTKNTITQHPGGKTNSQTASPGGTAGSGGTVTVRSENVLQGDITAKDGSEVYVGDTNLYRTEAEQVKITTNNTVEGEVGTSANSSVTIGSTSTGTSNGIGGGGLPSIPTDLSPEIEQIEPIVPPINPSGWYSPEKEGNDGRLPEDQDNNQCEDPSTNEDYCFDCLNCFIVDGCTNSPQSYFGQAIFGSPEDCCQEQDDLPCNNHDRCYQTCEKKDFLSLKDSCDELLWRGMSVVCSNTFSLFDFNEYLDYTDCQLMAATYLYFMNTHWSMRAFCKRQNKICNKSHVLCKIADKIPI